MEIPLSGGWSWWTSSPPGVGSGPRSQTRTATASSTSLSTASGRTGVRIGGSTPCSCGRLSQGRLSTICVAFTHVSTLITVSRSATRLTARVGMREADTRTGTCARTGTSSPRPTQSGGVPRANVWYARADPPGRCASVHLSSCRPTARTGMSSPRRTRCSGQAAEESAASVIALESLHGASGNVSALEQAP
jgi:hypothetical protein